MNRVVHFEIHTLNPEQTIAFYETVFGWQFKHWGGGGTDYWLVTTGPEGTPGINGGMMRRMGPAPGEDQAVNAYICTVMVANVDESIGTITANGGIICLAKMPIPGVGWLAYAKDPAGNIFGIMQSDEQAK